MYLNAKTSVEALHEIAYLVRCEIEKLNTRLAHQKRTIKLTDAATL